MSGGRLQRLMAAMALCGKPDLLVLDEPTTALDVTIERGRVIGESGCGKSTRRKGMKVLGLS